MPFTPKLIPIPALLISAVLAGCADTDTAVGFRNHADAAARRMPVDYWSETRPLGPILFATGSDALDAEANEGIARWASMALAHPSHRVAVRGHADARGARSANRALATRRALKVAAALVAAGLAPARVSVEGLGADAPADGGNHPLGQAKDRRAEISLIPVP